MGEVIGIKSALRPPDSAAWRLECGLSQEGVPVVIVSCENFQRVMTLSRVDAVRFSAMLMSIAMTGIDNEAAEQLAKAGETTLLLMRNRQLAS
jgi:hypothetical protein